MIWIILALTLGASITSIIHGVFMLFGSLSISGAAIPGIPSTMLSLLPIISAIFALIGGIIAFNQSKWGALFLFIAMGLCFPARDTWLYGGLYFFAGLFCFFLRARQPEDYADVYDDYDEDEELPPDYQDNDTQDFYYLPEENNMPEIPEPHLSMKMEPDGTDVAPQMNNEPPKLRRRMSKSCPECGAVVSRDAFYCPTCGAKLFVVSDDLDNLNNNNSPILDHDPLEEQEDMQSVNEQLFEQSNNVEYNHENIIDEPLQNYKTSPKTIRQEAQDAMAVKRRMSSMSANEAATSYSEFSRYSSKNKKRKKSAGKKILSMLLLVSAVGGALYFLLGLRKLPPGDLPPMVRPKVEVEVEDTPTQVPIPTQKPNQPSNIAEPVVVDISENTLPNFTPERNPRNGVIIGSNVNVRADHTTSSNRITRLTVGTRVEVIGNFNVTSGQYQGTWYNIVTGGREGWVYGKYLQPLGSGFPAGYSNGLLRTFGNNRSQLIENLGNPTRSTSSSVEWRGLTATVRGEDITRIRLSNSSRELQNGLKVGMSQTALLNIMGYPSSVNNKTLNYNENGKTGLSVQLDKNNAISSLTVNEVQ